MSEQVRFRQPKPDSSSDMREMSRREVSEYYEKHPFKAELDEGTLLIVKESKGILGIHTYTYDIVSFVPGFIVEGPTEVEIVRDRWLREENVKLGISKKKYYGDPEYALTMGVHHITQKGLKYEQKARKNRRNKEMKDKIKTKAVAVWSKVKRNP